MFIQSKIQKDSTKYDIKKNSFSHKYKFMSLQEVEFSADKITQVVLVENLADRIFKTCDILFYSIGSNKTLKFKGIKKNQNLIDKILSKVAIHNDESICSLNPKCESKDFFYSLLPVHILATLIIIFAMHFLTTLIISRLLYFLYLATQIYSSVSRLNLFGEYFSFHIGILTKYSYFARYENIKNTKVI